MKKIIAFVLAIAPFSAFAATPSTSCPAGYVAIKETYITIADNSCPSGTTSVGTAYSCLTGTSPTGACIMYAPTGISYTDSSGTYEFTSACPME